jgi:O-Antigen ligase
MPSEDRTAWTAPALAALIGAALLPALLTIYFSFQSGGYFPGAPALVAAQLALLLALRIAIARRPLEGVSPGVVVAAGALACFAAWALVSVEWSESPARAVPEYVRVLGYLLALVLFGSLPFSARRLRWMAYALAAGIFGVCAVAFLSRTMPDLIAGAGELQPSRLSYPLDYWNSLGLLAGLGVILCGHLACASRDHWTARVAGAAAVPLLTATLYYTFSRGATWATLAGIAVYVVVGRPRGLLAGALATAPPTIMTLMVINPASELTSNPRFASDTIATGHRTALIVLACMLAAGVIRAATLRLDSGFERFSMPQRIRRPVLIGAGVATVVVALAGTAALHVPDVVAEKYRDFNSDDARVGDSGSSRLLSGSDNGRRDHWEVSVSAVEREPLRGDGAGSYEIDWTRDRDSALDVHDGHSLYLETLGELGIVGFALLSVCLLVLLGGFAVRARGPNRALFAALLGAGVAWALAAAVDWDWEMPAVTIWLFAFGGAALARAGAERVQDEEAQPGGRGMRLGKVALRCAGVAACLAIAILPARLAVSEAHYERSLDSLAAGDCVDARSEAEAASDALGSRAAPHHVKAWCELQEGRYGIAAQDLEEALRNDPDNWALFQALAVTRARAGLDPRLAARRTAALNPLGELSAATRDALRGERPARWRKAARGLDVTLPESGDR